MGLHGPHGGQHGAYGGPHGVIPWGFLGSHVTHELMVSMGPYWPQPPLPTTLHHPHPRYVRTCKMTSRTMAWRARSSESSVRTSSSLTWEVYYVTATSACSCASCHRGCDFVLVVCSCFFVNVAPAPLRLLTHIRFLPCPTFYFCSRPIRGPYWHRLLRYAFGQSNKS